MADYNRAEELQAKRDGAKLVANSGRGMRKGDARLGNLLIDYKFTLSKSYSLNLEQYEKFAKQAFIEGMTPVTVAVFEGNKGRTIAMVDWDYLKELEEIKWMYEDLCK